MPASNADMSQFGSHAQEAKRLRRAAEEADWSGNRALADSLRSSAQRHRKEAAEHGDMMPLF